MKNIITAILSKEINEELSKKEKIRVLCKDILYQEALLEIVKKYPKIDYLILSENLPGNNNILNTIEKINEENSKIKIIYFYKKYQEQIEDLKIFRKISLEKINAEIIVDIIENKKVIEEKEVRIICVLGCGGVGKSTIAAMLAKSLSDQKEKTMLLEVDRNNTCKTIFKIKENKKHINGYFDYLDINQFYYSRLQDMIRKLKNRYVNIIIDTGKIEKQTELLLKISNVKVLLVEPNLVEISKVKNFMKKHKINEKEENIFMILNKTNINSIDDEIIKNILKVKIIGKIKYSKSINLFLNSGDNITMLKKECLKIFQNALNLEKSTPKKLNKKGEKNGIRFKFRT